MAVHSAKACSLLQEGPTNYRAEMAREARPEVDQCQFSIQPLIHPLLVSDLEKRTFTREY